jgi:hypothetical protein
MKNSIFNKKRPGMPGTALFLFLTLAVSTARSQVAFNLDPASKMTIEGTSTLHDWTSQVTQSRGSASFATNRATINGISSMLLEIPVKSIKSD